jgi:hypothetical protein
MNDSARRPAAQARRDSTARPGPHAAIGRPHGDTSSLIRESLPVGQRSGTLDVICAGMYRACSTWQYEVVAQLVEKHRGGYRVGYLTPEQYLEPGRLIDPRDGLQQASPQGWRVFKSHDGHPCFATAIAQGQAVAIYAYRDIRDVVFSLMHKRRWSFEQVLRQGMIHQVLANDRFWTRQPHVLIHRYDEILADPVGAVRGLAQHLGIELAAGEAERLAEEYSLAANKARTEALRKRLEHSGVDLSEAANSQICESATMLHWNHMRDGSSGSWIVESTPRERFILQRLCGRWLKARGYPVVSEADHHGGQATPAVGITQRLSVEREIARGWLSYQIRAVSQRFPRLAAMAKRALGIANPSQVGAIVWSEPQPETKKTPNEPSV